MPNGSQANKIFPKKTWCPESFEQTTSGHPEIFLFVFSLKSKRTSVFRGRSFAFLFLGTAAPAKFPGSFFIQKTRKKSIGRRLERRAPAWQRHQAPFIKKTKKPFRFGRRFESSENKQKGNFNPNGLATGPVSTGIFSIRACRIAVGAGPNRNSLFEPSPLFPLKPDREPDAQNLRRRVCKWGK